MSLKGVECFSRNTSDILVLHNYALGICLSNSSPEDKGLIEVSSKSSQPYLEKGDNAVFDIHLFKIQDCMTLSTSCADIGR